MSVIEANIIINVPDSVNPANIISELQGVISSINGVNTHINVVQIDDPLSLSPTNIQVE